MPDIEKRPTEAQSIDDSEDIGIASELDRLPVNALLEEVLRRKSELLTAEGWLSDGAFELADFLGTRVCVDGVPARVNPHGEAELMAIRRNTGPYTGKLTLIGGGVGRVNQDGEWVPESVEEALRRHFKTDLGFDIEPVNSWRNPAYVAQDMRPIDGEVRPGFNPNPASRHLIAARYLVHIEDSEVAPVFGATEIGGQEASGVEWFSERTMPDGAEFGYGHDETYRVMFPLAQQALGTSQ